MKRLKKTNESNGKIDPYEKLDNLFFNFIKELSQLGEIAHSEESHSNFSSSEKKSVYNSIKEYGDLLDKVNKKFNTFKSESKLLYGELFY